MKHSDETRAKALELLANVELSYPDIRNATGVPVGTLAGWAKQAGIERPTTKTAAATDARQVRIANRRSRLAEKLVTYAENLADKANAARGSNDAKNFVTAAAIALDKFRLEMGEATQVTESRGNDAAEVARHKVDELAERRTKSAS